MGSMSPLNLVYPVHLVQPNTRDRPNRPDRLDRPNKPDKPDNGLLMLAGFFSILLQIPTALDRLEQRYIVGIFDIHPDWNAIGDTRDPGSKRFQLVR